MPRIYAPNEEHNWNVNGVEFIHGAGAVPAAQTEVVAWFTRNGYDVEETGDTLTFWDKLTVAQLKEFAAEVDLDIVDKGKAEIVAAIETLIGTIPEGGA